MLHLLNKNMEISAQPEKDENWPDKCRRKKNPIFVLFVRLVFSFFLFCVRTLLLVMRTEGTENIFISYFCFLSIHLIALGILTIAFSQLFCSKDLANYLTGFSLNDFPISISKLSKWYIVKNNGNVNYFNYTSLILL